MVVFGFQYICGIRFDIKANQKENKAKISEKDIKSPQVRSWDEMRVNKSV